jgi:uncharacterized protein
MKFMDDPEAADWLTQFGGEPDDFEWDAGNRIKNRKHEVTQSDIEALWQHPLVFVGRIVEPVHTEDRWLVLGQNAKGRRLALVFTRRDSRLRPISCRSMRRSERTMYEEALSEDEETGSSRRSD